MESHLRSIIKSLSYRILGAIVTGIVAWFITGSFYTGITIGLADTFVKLAAYYLHERTWQKVRWGKTYPDMLKGHGEGI